MLDDILLQVNKPGRYIGREWNLPKKDFDRSNIKFALCFPDLYEIGMSNLGIRIIYGILNHLPDVVCERFFAYGSDMAEMSRSKNRQICSLESKRKLKEFDFIGFSLGYELNYTNVLEILKSGSIPLESCLRGPTHPLVIGGGASTLNPEPMSEFFDLFIIGEAEEAVLEIIDIYRELKSKFKAFQITRQELLLILSGIAGVYVPSLYEVAYSPEGKIEEFRIKVAGAPSKIKKRFIKNLNSAYFPVDWLIPYIQIVHDRITLEIMRGCPNHCYFCQARSQYFPFRQREIKNIIELALTTYARSGYEEISLSGLSVSDFLGIEELLKYLIDFFKEEGVSVSLPSIKPKAVLTELLSLVSTIKKTGLTFAPEAATERLRKVLNKNFDFANFFKVVKQAYICGYRNIKLYFMIGLPFEEDTDLDGIINLASRISDLRKDTGKQAAQVNISINTLIPKPHTPLQWFRMEGIENTRYKQDYLKKKSSANKRLKLNVRSPQMSFLEGALCRGDRRLSRVILSAYSKGARFDAWDSYFVFKNWQDAFQECGLNPNFYLQEKSRDEFLPWDFIDIGISKEALMREADKISEHITYESRNFGMSKL